MKKALFVMMAGFGLGEKATDEGKVFLEPGIHDVTITKVSGERPETKNGEAPKAEYLAVGFKDDRGKEVEKRWYFSEKAVEYSINHIKHLFNKIVPEEQLIKADEKAKGDIILFGKELEKLVLGKKVTVKFTGDINTEKNTPFTSVGFPPFAEKIGTPAEDSRLSFNPDVDVKKPKQGGSNNSTQGRVSAPAADTEWGEE